MTLIALAAITCGLYVWYSARSDSGSTAIDWERFLKTDGILYRSPQPFEGQDYRITEADLGPVVFRTRFQVSDNVSDPNYEVEDGDAAYLPEGTEVHAVRGFSPRFRLAVKSRGHIELFEASENPLARSGRDLLDLRTTDVTRIGVNSYALRQMELGAIAVPTLVERLVELVHSAPVDVSDGSRDDPEYFLVFYVGDGEPVVRRYSATGELHQGTGQQRRSIRTPDEFGAAVRQAVTG